MVRSLSGPLSHLAGLHINNSQKFPDQALIYEMHVQKERD